MSSRQNAVAGEQSISQSVETAISHYYEYFLRQDTALAELAVQQQLDPTIDLRDHDNPNYPTTRAQLLQEDYAAGLGSIALDVFDETRPKLERAFSFQAVHMSETAKFIGYHVVSITAQSRANQLHYRFADRNTKKRLLADTGLEVPRLPRDYVSPLELLTEPIVQEVPLGAAPNFYGARVAGPAFDALFSVAQIDIAERDDPLSAMRNALVKAIEISTRDSIRNEQVALQTATELLEQKLRQDSLFQKIKNFFSRR